METALKKQAPAKTAETAAEMETADAAPRQKTAAVKKNAAKKKTAVEMAETAAKMETAETTAGEKTAVVRKNDAKKPTLKAGLSCSKPTDNSVLPYAQDGNADTPSSPNEDQDGSTDMPDSGSDDMPDSPNEDQDGSADMPDNPDEDCNSSNKDQDGNANIPDETKLLERKALSTRGSFVSKKQACVTFVDKNKERKDKDKDKDDEVLD